MKHPTLFRALVLSSLALGTLAGCAEKREIQTRPSGVDRMLKSPCACVDLEYRGPEFQWVTASACEGSMVTASLDPVWALSAHRAASALADALVRAARGPVTL